jgi:hypothetical protein
MVIVEKLIEWYDSDANEEDFLKLVEKIKILETIVTQVANDSIPEDARMKKHFTNKARAVLGWQVLN